jgi:hypothetical protein
MPEERSRCPLVHRLPQKINNLGKKVLWPMPERNARFNPAPAKPSGDCNAGRMTQALPRYSPSEVGRTLPLDAEALVFEARRSGRW